MEPRPEAFEGIFIFYYMKKLDLVGLKFGKLTVLSELKERNNKRNNAIIFYKGKNYTIAQLSKILNINYSTLWNRTIRKNIFVYE